MKRLTGRTRMPRKRRRSCCVAMEFFFFVTSREGDRRINKQRKDGFMKTNHYLSISAAALFHYIYLEHVVGVMHTDHFIALDEEYGNQSVHTDKGMMNLGLSVKLQFTL